MLSIFTLEMHRFCKNEVKAHLGMFELHSLFYSFRSVLHVTRRPYEYYSTGHFKLQNGLQMFQNIVILSVSYGFVN